MTPADRRRLALPTLALTGVLAALGCQQLAQDLGGGGGDGGTPTTVLGSVCCGDLSTELCLDGTPCCTPTGDPCANDYECCAGLCNSSVCDTTGSILTAELGSRCTSNETCACTADNCFQGICGPSVVTSGGSRCCLDTGIPCGANGDCCTGMCDPDAGTCDP